MRSAGLCKPKTTEVMVTYLKQIIAGLVALAVIALLTWRLISLRVEMSELKERHEGNIRALTEKAETYRLHDSISVATAAALELKATEASRTIEGLKSKVKELGIRLRDVQSISTIETVTHDTIYLSETMTKCRDDTCLTYTDGWLNMTLCNNDNGARLSYIIRDSLTSYVHVKYQRKFLWWRWRPQYQVTVTSHNPRTEVKTASAIVITE